MCVCVVSFQTCPVWQCAVNHCGDNNRDERKTAKKQQGRVASGAESSIALSEQQALVSKTSVRYCVCSIDFD